MKRVVVAMSGGVDSSVAACLLKEEGYEVIGATMRIYGETGGQSSLYGCCGAIHVEDARRVCQQIGIPFYVFNLADEFEREVIQYFCDEYAAGRTPNPCILCNEKVKFGSLLRKAVELGADYLATGHYARVDYDGAAKRFILKKGVDPGKDQSYVLFSLSQDQLRSTLFPLGGFRKAEVRAEARKRGLRVHDKPESQEVCFIDGSSYHPFLTERLKRSNEQGMIVDREGRILGKHKGIAFYTIGQRRGLGLAAGRPLYVVGIDPEKNTVIVGEEKDVYKEAFTVRSVNWILPQAGDGPIPAWVKIRYNHPGAEATLFCREEGDVLVRYKSPQKAITPGQAAVFYNGETVLGGGWIEKTIAKCKV